MAIPYTGFLLPLAVSHGLVALVTQTLLSRTRPCLRVYCKTGKTPRAPLVAFCTASDHGGPNDTF
jgi:hypothetical protein